MKFVCPKCGNDELECKMEGIYYSKVFAINEESNEPFFDFGPIEGEGEIICWGCSKCEFTIKDEDGELMQEEMDVFDWIEENCKGE